MGSNFNPGINASDLALADGIPVDLHWKIFTKVLAASGD
jgi:hypothetical protein